MVTFPKFNLSYSRDDWLLARVLRHRAEERPDHPFLQWNGEGCYHTYAETNFTANRLAHGFAAIGVKKADGVVLFLPNSLDLLFMWFALSKLGAVEAPINDSYKGSFLEHQFNISGAHILVADEALFERVAQSEANMPLLDHVVVWSRDGRYSKAPYRLSRVKVTTFAELDSGVESEPEAELRPRDPGAILYTSGTTGPSKGVMMSHAHLYFFSECFIQLVGLTEADTCMTAYPLFHANAQFLTVYPTMIVGGRVVVYERFSAGEWVERLHQSQATVTNFLGATSSFVYAQRPSPRDRGHRLKRIFAVPVPHQIEAAFLERFGIDEMLDGFGQTEISMVFLQPRGVDKPQGSCGILLDEWFDVRLIDPQTEKDVPVGQVGELLVRHKADDIILSGYVGMPEKTLAAFRNLWFHTGDGMRRDHDGWYYFTDHMKDSLRRRGENISSYEVEAPIEAHDAVAAAAVIAVPAEFAAGEDEVKVCIVLKPGRRVSNEEMADWCDRRLPHALVPRYFEFVDTLPVTENGKVQKENLRAAGVTTATWDRVAAGYLLEEDKRRRAQRNEEFSE